MEKDTKKIIAGTGILIGTGIAYLLARRGPPAPPPPPGENFGMLQGYVLDSSTNDRLPTGAVLITIDNGEPFYNDIDSRGGYRTPYLPFGTHHFSIKADNYQTGEFDLEISETFTKHDFVLEPLPEAPTEWTDGIEIRGIEVDPPIVYVGETAIIKVAIVYPHPLPLPADIFGSVLVDGQKLTGQWTIEFRNPALRLEYTATQLGNFTVRALDKSTSFTVVQKVHATYYMPYGGDRMPICTEVVVPDVEPFTYPEPTGLYTHPGGDYVWRGSGIFWKGAFPPIRDKMHLAYPTKWSPDSAVIRGWKVYPVVVRFPSWILLAVIPTDYDCQPYWDTKEELAEIIGASPSIFSQWIPEEIRTTVGPRWMVGWRAWIKFPEFPRTCNGGYCTDYIVCPYCNEKLFVRRRKKGSARDLVSEARILIEHIESRHPDHPLTAPAWF